VRHKTRNRNLCINVLGFPFSNSRHVYESWGSSVIIVSGYGLDDRVIEVRSLAEAKGFFLQPVCQGLLWGPPSLLYNGTGGPLPGAKTWPERDVDHSSPSSAEVENE
jgi:hypothetical protein